MYDVNVLKSKKVYVHDVIFLNPKKYTEILIYRTRAIITRGLYYFYPIFHCGLYMRAVYTSERLVIT